MAGGKKRAGGAGALLPAPVNRAGTLRIALAFLLALAATVTIALYTLTAGGTDGDGGEGTPATEAEAAAKQLRGAAVADGSGVGAPSTPTPALVAAREAATSAEATAAEAQGDARECRDDAEALLGRLADVERRYAALLAARRAWGEGQEGGQEGEVEGGAGDGDASPPASAGGAATQEVVKTVSEAKAAAREVRAASSSSSSSSSSLSASPPTGPPLVVIGIPTVRREGDPDYVIRTVEYILEQTRWGTTGRIPASSSSSSSSEPDVEGNHPFRLRILVLSNTRADAKNPQMSVHKAFETLRERFCGSECGEAQEGGFTVYSRPDSLLVLARNDHPVVFDGQDEGNPNVPGYRVRQQTRDVSDVLNLAHALFGHVPGFRASADSGAVGSLSSGKAAGGAAAAVTTTASPLQMAAYMFMEDDFRLCPSAAKAIGYMLSRATVEHGEWNAIRTGYGLNGAILRGYDVPVLEAYYRKHLARRPPDHLLVEWFAGERPESAGHRADRAHVAFRYNILEHFGFASSLRAVTSPVYAYCYDELNDGVVFEVEAYKPMLCGHDDIWPCWPPGDPRYALGGGGGGGGPLVPADASAAPVAGIAPSLAESGIDFKTLAVEARAKSVQTWG
jgi:hypothetical protein